MGWWGIGTGQWKTVIGDWNTVMGLTRITVVVCIGDHCVESQNHCDDTLEHYDGHNSMLMVH